MGNTKATYKYYVNDDVYNSYVQRSSPRSNHLRAMKETLTPLKMVEIMRQMIQKEVLKKQKKKKILNVRLTLKRRLQCSIL